MATDLMLLELEITGRCQLECSHCYASSGPQGTHGELRASDWQRVIGKAADMGVPRVQFIGGEPTLHPDLPDMVRSALTWGLEVEIYTNLVRVTPEMWELFMQPGVLLATSYYSDDAAAHDAVTRRHSHARTRANIDMAVASGIPLRVAVIEIHPGQDVDRARATLRDLGVKQVHADRIRQIGRGRRRGPQGTDQLCGLCGDARMAVLPSGQAVPCVLSRWLTLGSVVENDLGTLYERAHSMHEETWPSAGGFSASGCPPTDGTPGCTSPTCTPPMKVCPPPCPPPWPTRSR